MLRFLVVPLLLLGFAAPADAQLPQLPGTGGPAPGAYRQNDAGGFRNILRRVRAAATTRSSWPRS